MTDFTITITSDSVCPWCYIGYRRLRKAISEHQSKHPKDTFSIRWNPFQLNPNAPKGKSIDKRASYEQKLGAEQTELVFARLRSAAEGTDIVFSFEGKTGNTLDSHRVIEFAGSFAEGKGGDADCGKARVNLQTRVVEEFFADYFERERDITSREVLVEAAGRAGLDEDRVRRLLESEELVDEVEQKARDSRESGLRGVPYFNINDVFAVEGAQEPAAFLMLFERLKKRERSGNGKSSVL